MAISRIIKTGGRGGFSMVEVLVASTILTVIVMMLGMLFQSTGLAWRTGVQRADTFMQIRGFFGAIQRDLSAAIDARELPEELRSGRTQSFSGFPLRFFTMTGTGFDRTGTTPYRSLTYITYDSAGNRTEEKLRANGSWDTPVKYNVMTTAERSLNPNKPKATVQGINAVFPTGDSAGLPLFVNIRARVVSSGYNLDIGAASAGPDGVWGTKDDIATWLKK